MWYNINKQHIEILVLQRTNTQKKTSTNVEASSTYFPFTALNDPSFISFPNNKKLFSQNNRNEVRRDLVVERFRDGNKEIFFKAIT